MNPWLSVIGIGDDGLAGLSPAARTLVETAETLVGGARHLAMVPGGGAERLLWRQPLGQTIADIGKRRGTRIAVLATGDPLWYGVGTVLLRHFRREEMTIVPQPSASCGGARSAPRSPTSRRAGARGSPCWQAATRCGTGSGWCLRNIFAARR